MMLTLKAGNSYVLNAELSLREALPVLSRVVSAPDFLDSHVLPLLEEAGRAEDWYVAYHHDDPDCSYSLRVFVWPPGSATKIHDRSSWEPSVVSWDPSWKNATNVPTMAPCPIMLA